MDLGVDQIDSEHKAQIGLLLAFEQSLLAGDGKDDLVIILDRLIEFSDLHFLSEQMLMRMTAYPGIDAHELDHDRLLAQVRKLQTSFNTGNRELTESDVTTLKLWLADHIRGMDSAFAQFLIEKNSMKAEPKS
jgi:hemerythrin